MWLNPPFSQPLCTQFIDKLLAEYDRGRVHQAIVLVNVSTGKWFHKLLARFPVAYPKHHPLHPNARIEFVPLPGNDRGTNNNSRGQALFYLGPGADRFFEVAYWVGGRLLVIGVVTCGPPAQEHADFRAVLCRYPGLRAGKQRGIEESSSSKARGSS